MRKIKQHSLDQLKERLPDYLISRGVPNHLFSREQFNFSCLFHEDKNPSCSYYNETKTVHCFSCGFTGDIFTLVEKENPNLYFWEIAEQLSKDFNIPLEYEEDNSHPPHHKSTKESNKQPVSQEVTRSTNQPLQDFTEFYKEAHKGLKETNHLTKRGITQETAERFNLGYVANWTNPKSGKQEGARLIIPYDANSYLARATEDVQESDRVRKAGSGQFNQEALQSLEPVFIVEGEIDALSIEQEGKRSIGLGGTSGTGKLLQAISTLENPPSLILSLDNDEAGRKAQEALAHQLDKQGIPYAVMQIPEEYKDPNEFLIKEPKGFKTWITATFDKAPELIQAKQEEQEQERFKEVNKYQASSMIESFMAEIEENAQVPPVSTGFKNLDLLLGGGLFNGLYTIGAPSSLGKSSFCLQMADQIAKQGRDVLFFTLEMGAHDLIGKSVSRETYQQTIDYNLPTDLAKSFRGIIQGEKYKNYSDNEREIIREAIREYSSYSDHIYIIERVDRGDGQANYGLNIDDIVGATEQHMRVTGRKPVVIVDYLQILRPQDIRADKRFCIDIAIARLKDLSREKRLPVIVISSVSRKFYNECMVPEAFKESGDIEYTSDFLIGLQLRGLSDRKMSKHEADNAHRMVPKELEAVILKNRMGEKGGVVELWNNPIFGHFKEGDIRFSRVSFYKEDE